MLVHIEYNALYRSIAVLVMTKHVFHVLVIHINNPVTHKKTQKEVHEMTHLV